MRCSFGFQRLCLYEVFGAALQESVHGVKGGVADVVLDFAGVRRGGFPIDPEGHDELREHLMAVKDGFGDAAAFFRKGDVPVTVHDDAGLVFQPREGPADRGLRDTHFIGNINGAHEVVFLAQSQNGFKIHFAGLLHDAPPGYRFYSLYSSRNLKSSIPGVTKQKLPVYNSINKPYTNGLGCVAYIAG